MQHEEERKKSGLKVIKSWSRNWGHYQFSRSKIMMKKMLNVNERFGCLR